jgi:hypothetical protein
VRCLSAARWFKTILVIVVASFSSFIYRPCHSFQGVYSPQTHRRLRLQAKQSSLSVKFPLPTEDLKIDIYDNLFDPETCNQLHQLACSHSDQIGDDSNLFYRNLQGGNHSEHFSPLESVLDGLLTQVLNDTTTKVVEYWSRQEYLNMDAHCDVDEHMLKAQQRVRCPEWAHILYALVQPNVSAPTCIIPTRKGGWETSLHERGNAATTLDVVVVPAVSGRLVRFPGNMMHAVPKPPHRWFLSKEDEVAMRELQQKEECSDSDKHGMERSVILFNCWSNTSPPPRGLLQEKTIRGVPSGIVIDGDDDIHASNTSSDDVPSFSLAQIAPVLDTWHSTPISTRTAEELLTTNHDELRIRLMGNRMRRQHEDAVVTFHTRGGRALWNALHEPHQPSHVRL